jgi:hypothetical protein
VRFSTLDNQQGEGEFKNTINYPLKTFLGKYMSKTFGFWPKKVGGKKLFSCRLFPSTFFARFWPFLSTSMFLACRSSRESRLGVVIAVWIISLC